jgi:hypothetical protein
MPKYRIMPVHMSSVMIANYMLKVNRERLGVEE